MIIYLDYLFIENVIFDYIILKEVAEISKHKNSNKALMVAAIISSMYVVIMVALRIIFFSSVITKIFLAFVTIYVAFKPTNLTSYVKLVLAFFMVSIVNVGVLIVLKSFLGIGELTGITKIAIYIFVYITGKGILFGFWKMYSANVTKNSLNYTVELQIGHKKYIYEGFLDTGNTVVSHGVPVIFAEVLNEEMLEELKSKEYFETKTVTLGNVSIKKAYVFDDVLISNGKDSWRAKVGVVFEKNKISKLSNYNMILNYILYIDSMGGVKI